MARSDSIVRVLHLIDSLDLGGAQTLLLGWLEVYDRARFSVEIAALHGNKHSLFYQRAAKLGISVHFLSPHKFLPLYVPGLVRLLLLPGYDVVHCHLFASNWLGKPLARLLRVPVVISHDHCNDRWRVERRWVCWIDAFANRCADRVFAVGETVRDFLLGVEHLLPEQVEVIPNGIPPRDEITPRQIARRRTIGGAGRFVAQKNFERFLAIADELTKLDPGYRFIIAGSGPQAQRLKEKALQLSVPVQWLGNLPELDGFFSAIDCFLLTSDFEGMPMVLLEALQLGLPVAATAVDGSATYFREVALLLDPWSEPRDLAQAIHQYLDDETSLQKRAELGKRLVEQNFSAESQIRAIETRYLQLLGVKQNGVG